MADAGSMDHVKKTIEFKKETNKKLDKAKDVYKRSIVEDNRQLILQLRQQNKGMRRQLSECLAIDKRVIKEAFQNKGSEMKAYKSVEVAATDLELQVLAKIKCLNSLSHTTQTGRNRLKELQLQCQRTKAEGSRTNSVTPVAVRLEETMSKCQDAEAVTTCYLKVKEHLLTFQAETQTYQYRLECLDVDIPKHREELYRQQLAHKHAQLHKQAAEEVLRQHEEWLSMTAMERESILTQYREQIQQLHAQRDKLFVEARPLPEVLSEEDQEDQDRIRRQEIEEHLASLEEEYRELQEQKAQTEEDLLGLKEELECVLKQFQDMKDLAKAELSSKQRQSLVVYEQQLKAAQMKCSTAKRSLDQLVEYRDTAFTQVRQLDDKLQPLTQDEGVAEPPPTLDSEERKVLMLGRCELKVQKLCREHQRQDQAAFPEEMDEMEEAEVPQSLTGEGVDPPLCPEDCEDQPPRKVEEAEVPESLMDEGVDPPLCPEDCEDEPPREMEEAEVPESLTDEDVDPPLCPEDCEDQPPRKMEEAEVPESLTGEGVDPPLCPEDCEDQPPRKVEEAEVPESLMNEGVDAPLCPEECEDQPPREMEETEVPESLMDEGVDAPLCPEDCEDQPPREMEETEVPESLTDEGVDPPLCPEDCEDQPPREMEEAELPENLI